MEVQISMNNKKTIIQFLKFGMVGLSNTLIGLVVYYLLLFMNMQYLLASIISGIISIFNAFYWNNKYVFHSTNDWLISLGKTYISYGLSFLVTTIFLWFLVEKCFVSTTLAPILTLVVTTPLNFCLNKFWTFK